MFGIYGELTWGLPVVLYLFLAGVGAGALVTSASVLLRGPSGEFGRGYLDVARIGAFLAPLPIAIGCGLLVLELGSFQVGNWFRFLNLYKVINLSPMSVGTWLLTFFIPVSMAYAATFLPWRATFEAWRLPVREALAWLGVPLGVFTALYTGILLGAMPSRPFWNTPILALLFLLSSISTGVAAILLVRAIWHRGYETPDGAVTERESDYLLTATDVLLIGLELVVIFLLLMYAHLTIGNTKLAAAVVLPGGELAAPFWIGVVAIGLVLPALFEFFYVIPRLLRGKEYASPRGVDIVVTTTVLIGGFLLRYVVVVAGQITGPVGI